MTERSLRPRAHPRSARMARAVARATEATWQTEEDMADPIIRTPKGVTKDQFLDMVRAAVHDAMRELKSAGITSSEPLVSARCFRISC